MRPRPGQRALTASTPGRPSPGGCSEARPRHDWAGDGRDKHGVGRGQSRSYIPLGYFVKLSVGSGPVGVPLVLSPLMSARRTVPRRITAGAIRRGAWPCARPALPSEHLEIRDSYLKACRRTLRSLSSGSGPPAGAGLHSTSFSVANEHYECVTVAGSEILDGPG